MYSALARKDKPKWNGRVERIIAQLQGELLYQAGTVLLKYCTLQSASGETFGHRCLFEDFNLREKALFQFNKPQRGVFYNDGSHIFLFVSV